MIPYKRHTLSNGLTVAVNRDRQSKLAAVNILYKVGARNEDPARTGFAHLFGELNVMNKAMNLGYYEMLGDPGLVNREVELYRSVTAAELTDFARRTFRAARRSTLIYRATR